MTIIFDQFQGYQQGVVKALGIQAKAVAISVAVLGIIYLPAAYFFAIKLTLGLKGLWLALLICMAILSICFDIAIEKTNWQKAADDSASRLNAKETKNNEGDKEKGGKEV